MKVLFFLLLPLCCFAQNLSNYNWLVGTWQQVDAKKEKVSTELWTFENNSYIGYSFTLTKGKKTFEESMTIKANKGFLTYSVYAPENKAWVNFTMAHSDKNEHLLFENKAHDFPKYIQYHLQNKNTIAAEVGDSENKIHFLYHRATIEDSTAIYIVINKMQLAYNSGNISEIANYYANDALITGGKTPVEGHEAIVKYWTGFKAGNWTLTSHWLKTYGDHAVQRGSSKIAYSNGTSDNVEFLLNWKKVDGQWKISQDIYW
jgi:ketosteroid isomerase-like protein